MGEAFHLGKEFKTPFSWRRICAVVFIIVIFIGATVAGLTVYTQTYTDRVIPGIHVGTVSFGDMSKEDVHEFLEIMSDKLVNNGVHFSLVTNGQTKELTLSPIMVVEGNAIDLMRFDVDRAVDQLIRYGKRGDILDRLLEVVQARFGQPQLSLSDAVWVNAEPIKAELEFFVRPYAEEPHNATIAVQSVEPLQYDLVSSSAGLVFYYDTVGEELKQAWAQLSVPDIRISSHAIEPQISEADVRPLIGRVPLVFAAGDITITYADPHTKQQREWRLTPKEFQIWLTVRRDTGNVTLSLDEAALKSFLEEKIVSEVNVPAENARFSIDETTGKVSEFQGSRPGITVDVPAAVASINEIFAQRSRHDQGIVSTVALAVKQVEPNITTGEVNTLGIKEVLGVGISNFRGSPPNRIANIKHAAARLNGVIVPPGQEFSTNKFSGPYTLENGYLPEKVIVGNKIELGVGGGMCQISTTLFRMAMNSGMPITERTNHGLVVSYYNDPQNGNPGTDATVFEPILDFRFFNDTGHAILVQTEVNTDKTELVFTLWGMNDGRSGSYASPVVSKWIKPGEEKIVPTTELAPGEKKCQTAYTGADTTFTYHRIAPDGAVHDQVFKSHYRPLPRICLLGVDVLPGTTEVCAPDDDVCRIRQAARAATSSAQ